MRHNTDGKRIYAIGDIHGCIDDLENMQTRIASDLLMRPHPDPLIIYLGDYCDRGPDSRAVVENLIGQKSGTLPSQFLFGNHDKQFLDFLGDPEKPATDRYHWLDGPLGGTATIRSYVGDMPAADDRGVLRDRFAQSVPEAHLDFLKNTVLHVNIGSYLFVHAGIRPGVPLADQVLHDLIWIREPFLEDPRDHGVVVVHGHTVVGEVENRGNRIDVDTGAVFGGRLSCLVLEDDEQWVLEEEGLMPSLVRPHFDD